MDELLEVNTEFNSLTSEALRVHMTLIKQLIERIDRSEDKINKIKWN